VGAVVEMQDARPIFFILIVSQRSFLPVRSSQALMDFEKNYFTKLIISIIKYVIIVYILFIREETHHDIAV